MVSFRSAAAALAPATAIAATGAEAQTAGINVGGIISVTNSLVKGDLSAVVVNGSAVVQSGIGLGNTINPFGGLVDVTGSYSPVNFSSAASIFVTNSNLQGNLSANDVVGSYVGSSAIGWANIAKGIGSVDQGSATFANYTAPNVDAVISISGSTVNGDVTATSVTNSLSLDSSIAAANSTSNYGGYDRVTMNYGQTIVPLSGSVSASILATDSDLTGRFSAIKIAASSIFSSSVGTYNWNTSVGSVVKTTFAPSLISLTPN